MGISKRAIQVPPSSIREIYDLALKMEGVYRLFLGESNIGTPDFIKKAAKKALDEDYVFYTANAGYLDLRQTLSEKIREWHQVHYDPQTEIAITAGGVMGIHLAIYTAIDPGEKAILISPAWPNFKAVIQMVGAIPVEIPLTKLDQRYSLDFDRILEAIDNKTKLIVCNSPSNPTGWVATLEEKEKLYQIAATHGLTLVFDEVYEHLVFTGKRPAPSIAKVVSEPSENLIILNSLSKTYSMTGWRVGYVLSHHKVISQISKLQEFTVSHATSIAQRAAITALREGEGFIQQSVEIYHKNRDLVCQRLTDMEEVDLITPEGAFYAFPRIKGMRDSLEFCKKLLLAKKVGLAPGSAFGEGGEGHVRICFAAEESLLKPALDKFEEFLKETLKS
jgi:aspartate/methionine/tyrosine aminotransferase